MTEYIKELSKAIGDAIAAMELALSSQGVSLTSWPPQDAWTARGVSEKLRAAIKELAAQVVVNSSNAETQNHLACTAPKYTLMASNVRFTKLHLGNATLDFGGEIVTFTGNADEAAKVFFQTIGREFAKLGLRGFEQGRHD